MIKKRIILTVTVGLLIVGVVFGSVCFAFSKRSIAASVETYQPVYNSFYSGDCDKYMKIDGDLSEEKWQNKNWFQNTLIQNVNGNMPKIKVTGFTTEKGVYIAAVAQDSNIVNDGDHTVEKNTAFDFCVAAVNVGEKTVDSFINAINMVIDVRGDCHSAEASNFMRAVKVDGKINSGSTKSATIEMFLPWSYLQINVSKGIPQEFYMFPNYRPVLDGEEYCADMKVNAVFPQQK